ncbi:Protein PEROXIN-4 [Zancudomyces culisetae]|uniref:Protein PEROXIN-4 n=1 Tax=Zancudomyces culisetae TaxID=1213189 RepID=A0A1R1PGP3_ZANCU|nr:Protein PEROXIN-4 [Zancudomyces culisetae]OMH80165.1 Protein PEROXIN-4 [Zancudomyces culisetae]|eukprot:OMH79457.1 Protein PEROXIN-4 [Zancudomyces culisetae]
MSTFLRRLQQELRNLEKNKPAEIAYLQPSEDDITAWKAILRGPDGSPYQGGLFELSIAVPETYPMNPPSVNFVTTVCHPNVHLETGEICLDILKDQWSPVWTIKTICTAIHSLMVDPEPNSPLNCDAGTAAVKATILDAIVYV